MRERVFTATVCAAKAAALLLLLATSGCAFLQVGTEESWSTVSGTAGGFRRLPPPPPRPERLQAALPAAAARGDAFTNPGAGTPGVYQVRAGETVYGIAREQSVDAYALITLNGLSPPFELYPGQRLRIPGRDLPPQVVPRELPAAQVAQAGAGGQPPPKQVEDGDAAAAPASLPEMAAVPRPPPAPAAPSTPPEPAPGAPFSWPIEGRIISTFGPKGGGLYNDGINIAVAEGTPVRAAATGVVAYAGNELRGFGNMLLIKHPDGWVTAYAHNQELLVRRGERVRRGQVIARAGASGAVDQPQLHFEIRKGKRAVDPLQQLPRPSAARTRAAG